MADIVARAGWDNEQLRKGAAEAVNIAQRAKSQAEKVMAGFGGLSGVAAALSGTALLKSTLDDLDRTAKISSRLGASAESMQRLAMVANLAGADLETTGRALTILNRALDDPANKKAAEAFERLGLKISDLKAASNDPFRQMQMLSRAFQEAQKTGTGMADIMALLGRSGAELIPLMRTAAAEFEAFSQRRVVSDEQIKQIENLNDRMTELRQTITIGIGTAVADAVSVWQGIVQSASETAIYAGIIAEEMAKGASFAEAQAKAAQFMEDYYAAARKESEAAAAAAAAAADAATAPATTTSSSGSPRTTSELAQVERLRLQYAEAQFAAIQRRSTLEQQLTNLTTLQARKAEEMRRAMDAGPQTEQAMLQFGLEDMKIDEQRLQLAKQLQDAQQAAKTATAAEVTAKNQALQSLMQEAELLQARANGDAARVALLEREQRIQDRVLQIKKELGIEGQKALDMATGIVDLEDKAAKAGEKGKKEKGRRIKGFSAEQMGGRGEAQARADQRMAESRARIASSRERGFGGLKEFYRLQERNPDGTRAMPLGKAFATQAQRNAPAQDPSVPLLDEIKALMATNNDYLASITAE
jgi:hypothetical protein